MARLGELCGTRIDVNQILLDTVEAAGFEGRRARRLRRRLLAEAPSEELVARAERGLRGWLLRRGV